MMGSHNGQQHWAAGKAGSQAQAYLLVTLLQTPLEVHDMESLLFNLLLP